MPICAAWRSRARSIRPGAGQLAEPAAHPASSHAGRPGESNEACAAPAILTALARRAYRRPVTAADVEPLLAFYREGAPRGVSTRASSARCSRLLISPEFLLRVEADPAGRAPEHAVSHQRCRAGVAAVVLPVEQHSRRGAARRWRSRQQLSDPAVLDRQVRRMIADPRVRRVRRATSPGSGCSCATSPPRFRCSRTFPDFDDTLRQAFRRETELFFESVVREDRSALDLLRADYTFLNERLARALRHAEREGQPLPPRDARRRTAARRPARPGQHSHGDVVSRSHVAGRARQVDSREPARHAAAAAAARCAAAQAAELCGEGALDARADRAASGNPACASCHAMMDPLGLALENFDARRQVARARRVRRRRSMLGRDAGRHEIRRRRPGCARHCSAPIASSRRSPRS